MLRNFTNVVNEVIEQAYEDGINLFLESLEEDLAKSNYIQENGLENTLSAILLTEDNTNTPDVINVE